MFVDRHNPFGTRKVYTGMNANQYRTPPPGAGVPAAERHGTLARGAGIRGLRPTSGLGTALVLLIGAACTMLSVAIVLRWISYATVKARVDGAIGRNEYMAERNMLGLIEVNLWPSAVVVMLAAWIVLVVWLGRARANVDNLNPSPQTLSPKWALWSWPVPPVLLWFPAVFVNDIDKASVPQRRRGVAAVAIWWLAWLLAWAPFWVSTIVLRSGRDRTIQTMESDGLDALFQYSVLRSVSVALFCIAAISLAIIVVRVGRSQRAWAGMT